MSLRFDRAEKGELGTTIFIRGTIDETADLDALFGALSGPVTFNLGGVERINSIGIKGWLGHFRRYTQKYPSIVVEVAYPFMIQANSIANIFGTAEVRSCFAPYYCTKCGASRSVLVRREELKDMGGADAPKKSCEVCRSPLDFDELESYFQFFNR